MPVRQRNARIAKNIDAVRENVRTDPTRSVGCRSQKLGIPKSSLRRIMQNDLNLHAIAITNLEEIGNKSENRQSDEMVDD